MATMKKEIEVNKAGAEFFYNQCAGSYSGHMAHIPNNPVIGGFVSAHGADSRENFAEFLRQIADKLDKKEEQPWD